jgi:hypothetical protein
MSACLRTHLHIERLLARDCKTQELECLFANRVVPTVVRVAPSINNVRSAAAVFGFVLIVIADALMD